MANEPYNLLETSLVHSGSLVDYNTELVPAGKPSITAAMMELDETITSMIVRTEDRHWECTSCGKTSKKSADLKRHVESMHVEGMEHPCNNCGKTFRSRNALRLHIQIKQKTLMSCII